MEIPEVLITRRTRNPEQAILDAIQMDCKEADHGQLEINYSEIVHVLAVNSKIPAYICGYFKDDDSYRIFYASLRRIDNEVAWDSQSRALRIPYKVEVK